MEFDGVEGVGFQVQTREVAVAEGQVAEEEEIDGDRKLRKTRQNLQLIRLHGGTYG